MILETQLSQEITKTSSGFNKLILKKDNLAYENLHSFVYWDLLNKKGTIPKEALKSIELIKKSINHMPKNYWAHKTANIQKGARIGKGTKVWHNSQIINGAQIGEDCVIGHNCLIQSRAKLGNGVKLESNIDVWDLVILEDYVFVGPSAVFTNDINPRAKYPKKKYPQHGQWLPTLVREGATIGANATIISAKPKRIIGKWALVGAGAVIVKDVPDYAIVVGVPSKVIGWVCECGNKINFKSTRTSCRICKRKYQKKGDKVWRL